MNNDAILRQLGDRLGKELGKRQNNGVNISYGTVKAVNVGSGTVSLNVYVHGGTLYGLPMTTSCKGVKVGDRVMVETYGNLSTVTGVIARDNSHYVICKSVDADLGGSMAVWVTAPDVDGYTFLCWVQVSTIGWIGSAYPEIPMSKSTTVWSTTSGGRILCTALYQRG